MGKVFGTVFALDAGAIILFLVHDLTVPDRLPLLSRWIGHDLTLLIIAIYLSAAFGSAFLSWLAFAVDDLLVRAHASAPPPAPAARKPEPPLGGTRSRRLRA